MGAPARARSPTASSALWRTNSSEIAQALAVDDAVVADRDGVLERGAKGEARSPQPLHILHEAEGAGPRQLAAEGTGIDVDLDPLGPDQRRVELDLDVEVEAVMGRELAKGAPILDADGLQDLEEAAGAIELDQADLVDRLDEARSAAIHDRNFGAVDLDQGVVDAKAAQSREQVLDGRHRGAIAVTKHGAQRHARHPPLVCSDLGAFGIAVGEKEA